jgi:hypothetical protein
MSDEFVAYSPVTGERYDMVCQLWNYTAYLNNGQTIDTTHCYGGTNAEVVIW